MSTTTTKLPYAEALAIADHLVRKLEGACERILIAGSLRRRKDAIGDIELVAQPRLTPQLDIFEQPIAGLEHSALDDALAQISWEGQSKNGPKYKQYTYKGVTVDLFIASRETWGCVATIRTGSADFSHWLVTPRRQGGGCPSHLRFSEGRIWAGAQALDTPEERDVFEAMGIGWVEPVERREGRWRR